MSFLKFIQGPMIYFFDGRSPSRHKQSFFIYFLEGITPLKHWYINPNEKTNKYLQILSSKLTYQSLNGALP